MSNNRPALYSKPEVLLGDLRGGLCSSGLCKQLRAVAADEIERLDADAANEKAEKESLAAVVRTRDQEIERLKRELKEVHEDRNAHIEVEYALLVERDRLLAALEDISKHTMDKHAGQIAIEALAEKRNA